MGLLEELKLNNIKTVSVERKKFDFYGEMIRYVIICFYHLCLSNLIDM
jgi:hypothetical protein